MAMKDKRLEKKFVRLLRMIDYINNNLALTAEEIAEYLGVCRRTVFRYLEDLKTVDDLTVIFSNTTGYAIKFDADSKFTDSRNMFIWTSKDMRLLEFLYNQGVEDKKIADLLERTEQAIRVRRSIMGLTRGGNK